MQRLVKTQIKKNLYYEIKDKVIEESYNGIRMNKVTRKTKVYGLSSTKDVRHRLIEILFERVRYHKDKFVSEIILNEMKAMETKKNGKIEHSSNTHDDQVFSYLMALYVWYDGKNLAENWHISKNTLKTDQNLELDEFAFEDELEEKEHIDVDIASYDPESEAAQALEWIEKNSHIITSDMMKETELGETAKLREYILGTNEQIRNKYAEQFGVDPSMYDTTQVALNYVKLPDSIFSGSDENDYLIEDEDMYDMYPNEYNRSRILQGNLAKYWDRL